MNPAKIFVVGNGAFIKNSYRLIQSRNGPKPDFKAFNELKIRNMNVRVRSTTMPKEAIVEPSGKTTASVTFALAEEGIAPGQACVFYEQDSTRILGGGWITKE